MAKRLWLQLSICLLLVCSIVAVASVATATGVTVIRVFTPMNFGTPTLSGGVYTYANVFSKDGITVDAHMTIQEQVNATISRFDDITSSAEAFRPAISVPNNGEGYVRYKINFVNRETGEPAYLTDFFLTVVDHDGSVEYSEFAEISGFTSYAIDRDSELTVIPGSNGRTRFIGASQSVAGETFDNAASLIAYYEAPVSSIDVVLGITNRQTTARQFSVNFGLPGGVFSNPRVYPNPASPTTTVNVDDGGDGKLTTSDDLAAVEINGTTDAGLGQPVIIAVTDSEYQVIYAAATVTAGGNYSVPIDMSALANGPITVVATAVNTEGNPSAPATAWTTKDVFVNVAPSFTTGPNVTVAKNAGPQTMANWATDISPGPPKEAGQSLTFLVSNDNHALFSAQPAIDPAGTLTFTPAPNAHGWANVIVTLQDDGGTANGGKDTSAAKTFTITIVNINTPPTLAPIGDHTVDELTFLTFTAIGSDIDLPDEELTYSLIGAPAGAAIDAVTGAFTWTPQEDQDGVHSFKVRVTDSASAYAEETIKITVRDVNVPPILAPIGKKTTSAAANLTFTVSATDSDLVAGVPNTLTYTALNMPPGASFDPATRTFMWSPAGNQVGAHFITFQVNDGTETVQEVVEITVSARSTPPGPPPSVLGIGTVDGQNRPFATSHQLAGGQGTEIRIDVQQLDAIIRAGTNLSLNLRLETTDAVTIHGLSAGHLEQLQTAGSSLTVGNAGIHVTIEPAHMDLAGALAALGHPPPGEVAVHIAVAPAPADVAERARQRAAAHGYELLTDPVIVTITLTHNDRTVPLQRAAGTGARYIALPDGMDPSRITTGVAVNADGTIFHLSTRVVHMDSRYYAIVHDLANHATFAVVSHRAAFGDVSGHWAADDTNDMGARFIIMGTSETAFDPDRHATRSEFTTFIARAFGLLRHGVAQGAFADVPVGSWQHDPVVIATEYGIVQGHGDAIFGGDGLVTREQAMTMIARAMRLVTGDEPTLSAAEAEAILSQYSDSGVISGWARQAMAYLIQTGIVQGDPAGRLRPADPVTRAEAAALVRRILQHTDLID